MKSFFSLLFLCSLLFLSCKKELKPQDNSSSAKIVPFTEAANSPQDQSVMQNQNQNTFTENPTPATVADGMNPAHGQPSHRCDIPVGAPLNSTATSQKNPTVVAPPQNKTTTTSISTTNSTPTPEGMNPPHGEENHRCDIAVGAPLPKE